MDTTTWEVYLNEGIIKVDNGIIHLYAPGNTQTFPFVQLKNNVFPQSGEFNIRVGMQFCEIGPHGTGIVIGELPAKNSREHSEHIFRVWQDKLNYEPGERKNGDSDTSYHHFEFRWLNDANEIYSDGKLISRTQRELSRNRPTTIWLGNSTKTSTANQWTNFKVDYIEVVQI